MSAIFSECGTCRYRLDRSVQENGVVIAYFGINGSTATATENDHTVRKWIGFTERNSGRRLIVGNAFGYRATNVAELACVADPVGPHNDAYIDQIIAEADILVPCWRRRTKVPWKLRARLDVLAERLFATNKPVKIWCEGKRAPEIAKSTQFERVFHKSTERSVTGFPLKDDLSSSAMTLPALSNVATSPKSSAHTISPSLAFKR